MTEIRSRPGSSVRQSHALRGRGGKDYARHAASGKQGSSPVLTSDRESGTPWRLFEPASSGAWSPIRSTANNAGATVKDQLEPL